MTALPRWLTRPGLLLAALAALAGCASYPVNPPLAQVDESAGYRSTNRDVPTTNSDEIYIILSLSGGGTRAAALDYGVLEHLDEVKLPDGRSVLDEVDIITSSSAASLASGYYAALGRDAFFEDFRELVLYRKLQSQLMWRFLTPWQWPRLWSRKFSRSDLFAEYLDRQIFAGTTFQEMSPSRPFIMLNATDISLGSVFSFIQPEFDKLCSDLDQVQVARAVTASLAFTGAFTPITLKNYPKNDCGYTTPDWVKEAIEGELDASSRRYDRARNWLSYEDDTNRAYIHLLDSGIADNIGLRAPKLALMTREQSWSILDRIEDGTIQKLVVIVIDARQARDKSADQKGRTPGLVTSVISSTSSTLENFSSETIELFRTTFADYDEEKIRFEQARRSCDEMASDVCAASDEADRCMEQRRRGCYAKMSLEDSDRPPRADLYFVHARFGLLSDEDLRQQLMSIPTSLQLPDEAVDLLIESAPAVLEESEAWLELKQDLQAQ